MIYRYPLIIRLETLADKTARSQHSLDTRSAGEALVPWVQSQTTCAVLGDVTPGTDEEHCRVLRQRIWVHELFYDLQVCPPYSPNLPCAFLFVFQVLKSAVFGC